MGVANGRGLFRKKKGRGGYSRPIAFGVLSATAEPANDISVLADQAIPVYRQHKIALQAVAAGPGLAVGNASYLSYLKSQGIRLGLLPAGLGTNGFIERFEVCVRKNFLADVLRDQAVGGLEGLQAGFDDWPEPYTHATPRAG